MERPAQLTFLGHSTVLIDIGGVRILTDPVLFDRVIALRRVTPSLDPRLYESVDLVLLSHLHLDHFDVPSLRLLGRDIPVIAPVGARRLMTKLGFRYVTELRAWETFPLDSVEVKATPAAHSGFRPPLGPRAAAVGYLVAGQGKRIYFAGDTGLFDEMTEVAPAIDVALLPVWGWGPTLGRGHLNPQTAALAMKLLAAEVAIPIHWGTLWPFGLGRVRPGRLEDPPLEFAAQAAKLVPDATVLIALPGQAVTLPVDGIAQLSGTLPP
jgi:L-ascorbate metabolism protein UlaG (beta-lactamase superfamily)